MTDIDFTQLTIVPDNVDLVIYHGRCSDGFGSALASYIYFKSTGGLNKYGKIVEYHPASFSGPPPDVTGRNVLICDFSYKYDILTKMIADANSLAVIDHHKTAEAELKLISDKNKVFRMDHSGAYLTWKYFFPTQNVPLLIKYIEDNDIWLKKLPSTKEVTAYIYALPFEFEEYEKLLDDDYITHNVIPTALGMGKQNSYYVDQAMSMSTQKFVQIGDKYYFVAHLNTSVLKSEIGNQIFNKQPNCDFSAVYSLKDSTTYFSLRSTDDRADVSAIASKYGGGGHRNASGMTTFGSVEFPAKLLDNNVMYKLLDNIYLQTTDDGLNIVYLNTTHNRKHIGQYLLQQRAVEKFEGTDRVVQEACSAFRNKLNDKSFYKKFSFCCVWSYDGSDDKSWYTVHWAGPDKQKLAVDKFGKFDDYQLSDRENRIIFSVTGVNKFCL